MALFLGPYPTRWKLIKAEFTRYLKQGGKDIPRGLSRLRYHERGIWQRRYWEHTVRDEEDLKRCVDYVHWNPKKHGHVNNVRDWPWSSFHRFVGLGEYTLDWARTIHTHDVMILNGANRCRCRCRVGRAR